MAIIILALTSAGLMLIGLALMAPDIKYLKSLLRENTGFRMPDVVMTIPVINIFASLLQVLINGFKLLTAVILDGKRAVIALASVFVSGVLFLMGTASLGKGISFSIIGMVITIFAVISRNKSGKE